MKDDETVKPVGEASLLGGDADEREGRSKRPFAVLAGLLTVGVVGGVALGLAHCTRSRPHDGGDGDRLAGARLYRTYCGLCHGDEGEGYAADDANALANQDFLVSVSDEFLTSGIAEGRPGTAMAPYHENRGGPLNDLQVAELVAFIRGWQEEPTVQLPDVSPGQAHRAGVVFGRECASCHGDDGEGETAVSLNNPQFLAHASDAQIRYAISKGRRGTPMPAFEGELREGTIDDMVALIRSWAVATTEEDVDAPIGEDMPIVVNPDGEAPTFSELREGRYVPAAEVAEALEQGRRIILLDARAPSDYIQYHIPGAIPSPYYGIESTVQRLPRDGTWIIAYCGCPHAASGRVMDRLRDEGFENTAVLDEGVRVWRDEGYAIASGSEPGSVADAE